MRHSACACCHAGFDVYNSTAVRVSTKVASTSLSWCNVTKVTTTNLTCVTNAVPKVICGNATNTTCTISMWVTPSDGSEFTASTLGTYTYDPNLTPVITSVSPIRGSTEGGTLITITGSNLAPVTASPSPAATPPGRKLLSRLPGMIDRASNLYVGDNSNSSSGSNDRSLQQAAVASAGPVSVAIGGVPCTNVVQRDGNTLTCETGKPPGAAGAKPQGPLAVVVTVDVSTAGVIESHLWQRPLRMF